MERHGAKTLSYAVRPTMVAKCLGQLCGLLALLNLVPCVVALGFEEYQASLGYLWSALSLGVVVLMTYRLPPLVNLQTNEALVVTALAFVVASAALVYPFKIAGLSWLDAVFESVSGITTTGLTTVADVEAIGGTFLFARAWVQWYSGLGIVILSLALLLGPGTSARRLAAAGGDPTDIVATSRLYARRVMIAYGLMTLTGILVVVLLGEDIYNAILHVLTGISTAGYSPFNDSLAGLQGWPVPAAVLFGCIVGAVPFALFYQAWRGNWRRLLKDREVHVLLLAIGIVTVVITMTFLASGQFSASQAIAQAAATAVSAQTTTGFSVLDIGALEPVAKGVLILSMATGGTLGSTAGGIKIIRLLILFKLLHMLIMRTAMPRRAVLKARFNGHTLEPDEIQCTLLIILLYVLTISLAWLPFLVYGHHALDALFEVVSAAATVGLSTGISAPDLEPGLKVILCAVMLLGRVEVLAFIVLFTPGTWFGRRNIGQ